MTDFAAPTLMLLATLRICVCVCVCACVCVCTAHTNMTDFLFPAVYAALLHNAHSGKPSVRYRSALVKQCQLPFLPRDCGTARHC